MMRMMNVLRTFVAEILILHRVQAINWIQKLWCRHQRRQLLKWLIVHSHQVVVWHRFALYARCSVCELKSDKLLWKNIFSGEVFFVVAMKMNKARKKKWNFFHHFGFGKIFLERNFSFAKKEKHKKKLLNSSFDWFAPGGI